jgi:hypothetical protein
MLKKTLAALGCAGVLATAGAFAAGDTTPSCCHKGKQAAEQPAQKMRCSLTGKTVDTCCCEQRQGRLHCTLADKDVATCCCKRVDGKEAKKTS